MFIDPYGGHWLDRFDAPAATGQTYLLIDGVFVPGLHRQIRAAVPSTQAPSLLFENLPSCSDSTRDVSPFVVQFQPSNLRFRALLERCSGWPMICAIESAESQAELAERLAAWGVVEVDGQRFNFRFPDTRRLPVIFDVLSAGQRAEFAGPAIRWSYIDRSGKWRDLAVPGTPCTIADRPRLDDDQFAKLVSDSEADEVTSILVYRGHEVGLRSQHHAIVSLALRVARNADLDTLSKVSWCESCLADGQSQDEHQLAERLRQWIAASSTESDALLTKEA